MQKGIAFSPFPPPFNKKKQKKNLPSLFFFPFSRKKTCFNRKATRASDCVFFPPFLPFSFLFFSSFPFGRVRANWIKSSVAFDISSPRLWSTLQPVPPFFPPLPLRSICFDRTWGVVNTIIKGNSAPFLFSLPPSPFPFLFLKKAPEMIGAPDT